MCGFPAGLLDVLLDLVAEFDLQLLGLQLQVLLSVGQSLTCLTGTQAKVESRAEAAIATSQSYTVLAFIFTSLEFCCKLVK